MGDDPAANDLTTDTVPMDDSGTNAESGTNDNVTNDNVANGRGVDDSGPAGHGTSGTGRHPLLRPWWLVAHLIVLTVLVTFPQLAMWQWERHREEQAIAARIDARIERDPVPLSSVLTPEVIADFGADDAVQLEFTSVVITGTWQVDEQVAQRNRSYGGQGGFDVLTPLYPVVDAPASDSLSDMAVLIRRGWVPPQPGSAGNPMLDVPLPGEVTVVGWLERAVPQPSFGPIDPESGILATVFNADVERLSSQVDAQLLPMLVHLSAQDPSDGDLPIPQPVPARDTTQNLSYVLQWAAFTLIVGIGYGIVVVRRVRDHRAGIDSDVDPLLRGRPASDAKTSGEPQPPEPEQKPEHRRARP